MGNNQTTPLLDRDFDTDKKPHPFRRFLDKPFKEIDPSEEKGWSWMQFNGDPCLLHLSVSKWDNEEWKKMSDNRDIKAHLIGVVCHDGGRFYPVDVNNMKNSPFLLDKNLNGYFYYAKPDVGTLASPNQYSSFDKRQKEKANKLFQVLDI